MNNPGGNSYSIGRVLCRNNSDPDKFIINKADALRLSTPTSSPASNPPNHPGVNDC